MQAIITHYIAPTNYRGTRIRATSVTRNIVTGWDYELDAEENHCAAAHHLAKTMGWLERNTLHGGQMPNGDYAWTLRPLTNVEYAAKQMGREVAV